jgi:hypothetical protein
MVSLLPAQIRLQKMLSLAVLWKVCFCFSFCFCFSLGGTPAPEEFFHHQIVDHLDPYGDYAGEEWVQRYYTWDKEFQGPGHPIFVIMGGEGHIPPETGLYYPFITHHLAKIFGAYVLEPEHRFYGKSQPLLHHPSPRPAAPSRQDPREKLFTSEQALHDAVHLLDHIKKELGCSPDKFSQLYCPVVTVGGSYPGFLSAMARVMFPHKVDMAYSASAPIRFYSQQVNQYAYYDHITKVSDQTLPGCADAVRKSLGEVKTRIMKGQYNASILGICEGTIPDYIHTETKEGLAMFVDELMMVVAYSFANDNMANYPPGNATRLYKACETFTSSRSAFGKFREFLLKRLAPNNNNDCWEMASQLPTGPNATISSGDWSGVGTGMDGESWDFQTCTLLVEAIGFSKSSMFPPRDWSLDWLRRHCQERFGVIPAPYNLVRRWKFNDLAGANVTRIVFTQGLKDGWSVSGFVKDLSDTLVVLNFPNGAHHSDLSGKGPTDGDSEDIKQGFKKIIQILGTWLDEIRPTAI